MKSNDPNTTYNPERKVRRDTLRPSTLQQHIVRLTGPSGWSVFTVMADARASDLAITRALQKQRPHLNRHTVSKWVEIYRQKPHN